MHIECEDQCRIRKLIPSNWELLRGHFIAFAIVVEMDHEGDVIVANIVASGADVAHVIEEGLVGEVLFARGMDDVAGVAHGFVSARVSGDPFDMAGGFLVLQEHLSLDDR